MTIKNNWLMSSFQTEGSTSTVGSLDSASSVSPVSFLNMINGTADISIINPPIDGYHLLGLIFTDASPGSLLTSGNILAGTTPSQNLLLLLAYNPFTKKYSISEGAGGGTGNPASPNTSIQFNDGGNFGGFGVYDEANLALIVGGAFDIGQLSGSPTLVIGADDDNAGSGGQIALFGDTTSQYARLISFMSDGTIAIPTKVISGTTLFRQVNLGYYDDGMGSNGFGDAVSIDVIALEDFESTQKTKYRITAELFELSNDALIEGDIFIANGKALKGVGELDLISASGLAGNDPGFPIVLTAGDGNGSGLGGSISLIAGGSGSGTPGDIILSSSDFIQLLGPVLFGTSGSIATGTTNGNSLILRGYDVDGAGYKTFLTLTSGNTPDMTIAPPSGGTVNIKASDYKSSDDSSGITTSITAAGLSTKTITVKNGLITAFA